MLLNISDIQHFCVSDGDGIRTTVFFKGCNMHCPWCHNPETISQEVMTLRYNDTGKIKISGRLATAGDIMPELLEDKNFYDESGGGVTLSGGEVMLQADGAAELAALLKACGVSVAVDTAGNVPYSEFEKLNPYTDTYLYDYKSGSEELCRSVTGGNLKNISENLVRLLECGKDVRLRIPLIPDFNTDSGSIHEICLKLKETGISQVELLPFHRLGTGKYRALGMTYKYAGTPPISRGELDEIKRQYGKYFKVKIEI